MGLDVGHGGREAGVIVARVDATAGDGPVHSGAPEAQVIHEALAVTQVVTVGEQGLFAELFEFHGLSIPFLG